MDRHPKDSPWSISQVVIRSSLPETVHIRNLKHILNSCQGECRQKQVISRFDDETLNETTVTMATNEAQIMKSLGRRADFTA